MKWIVDVKDMNDSIYQNYTKVNSDINWQLHTLKKFEPLRRLVDITIIFFIAVFI